MSFFENTRDPKGFGGRLMVTMMNLAHTPVALWGGFTFCILRRTQRCWTVAAAAERISNGC